jgi:glycerophosphoryl diester phosphodiesterase
VDDVTQRPTVIGSCGISGLRPINTLASFEHALDHELDGIEFDYQVTADGRVVGHHAYVLSPEMTRDERGEWLAEPGPPLRALTLEQLQRYDVGRAKPGSRQTRSYPDQVPIDGARIPTLDDLLDALATRGDTSTELWVEVKTDPYGEPDVTTSPEAFIDALLPRLESASAIERTVLIAFDWRVLRLALAAHSRMRTGFLTMDTRHLPAERTWPAIDGRSPWWGGWDPVDHGGSFVSAVRAAGGTYWSPYLQDVTPELVAGAPDAGVLVSTWGSVPNRRCHLPSTLGWTASLPLVPTS